MEIRNPNAGVWVCTYADGIVIILTELTGLQIWPDRWDDI